MAAEVPPLVLFTYPESVVGRRTEWYLAVRGIPYHICRVDSKMPRPVLDRLDVHYRRIPVLAVGRDIYCDSRCIIDHLERLYPSRLPKLGSNQPYERGIERVLETWAFDGGLFARTAQMITPDASLVQDQAWLNDRAELTGVQFSPDGLKGGKKDALSHTRVHLKIVEDDLLADGRPFLNGEKPGLADIHVLWIFDWMMRPSDQMGMAHAYPWLLNEQNYPRTLGWVDRMKAEFSAVQDGNPPKNISDDEAIQLIEVSDFWEPLQLPVDESDPVELKRGDEVDLIALDSASAAGTNRRGECFRHMVRNHVNHSVDVGKLEGLTVNTATIRTETANGATVRIHYQRTNVRVVEAGRQPRLRASEIPKK